eukprot:2383518-Pyramimonas_sp.AAC.1
MPRGSSSHRLRLPGHQAGGGPRGASYGRLHGFRRPGGHGVRRLRRDGEDLDSARRLGRGPL